jgi:hypothetical protein
MLLDRRKMENLLKIIKCLRLQDPFEWIGLAAAYQRDANKQEDGKYPPVKVHIVYPLLKIRR